MLDARTKQIWRGLVDYANATDLDTDQQLLIRLAEIVSEFIPAMAREMSYHAATSPGTHIWDIAEEMKRAGSGWNFVSTVQSAKSNLASDEGIWFQREAREHHDEITRVLKWFCKPKPISMQEVEEYVTTHGTYHVSFNQFIPKPPLRCGLSDIHPDPSYEDLADPICQFILIEHQRYHKGDYDRFKGLVPIRFCKRPDCRNLVIAFKKKEYCGTSTCDEQRQRRDTDVLLTENRDRVYLTRLRSRKLRDLDAELMKGEVISRLQQISSFWPRNTLGRSLHRHASRLLQRATRIKTASDG